jgi:hypothetical protein
MERVEVIAMLRPEVVLRFRRDDGGEPVYAGATESPALARVVAEQLVRDAASAASTAAREDPQLGALLRSEAARLRSVRHALDAFPEVGRG